MTDADLTQWARSPFKEISNPASAGNISAGRDEARSEFSDPLKSHSPPVDTSPAPDFRYRPVTTSVRRRG